MDVKELRESLGIDDYLELVKEDKNCNGAYISFGQYMYLLENKIQELKEQYCERTDCSGRIKNSKQYDSLVQRVESQQKEFIEYLESEIKSCELVCDLTFNHNKEMKVYKEVLEKYKEIIGIKNE